MKVYVLTKLEERGADIPELDVLGVYGRKNLVADALADAVIELMENDEDFKGCLLEDENHEDFPKESGKDEMRKYVREEAEGGAYYVWCFNTGYKFDIFENDLDVPEM